MSERTETVIICFRLDQVEIPKSAGAAEGLGKDRQTDWFRFSMRGEMAGFNAHLTSGMVAGAFFSAVGWAVGILTLTQAGAIFVMGAVAALLPDLDSDTGKPLLFLSQVVSVLVPSMLWYRVVGFRLFARSGHLLFHSYLPGVYHGVCGLIRRLTVHRGMMHSLPFCLTCAGLAYLLFAPLVGWRRHGPP